MDLATRVAEESSDTTRTSSGVPPRGTQPAEQCFLALCTIARNETAYVREWVEYHRVLGAELFVLYDDGSPDDLRAELRRTPGAVVVEWPFRKAQGRGFSDCYRYATEERGCEWAAFVDVDEFVLPRLANKDGGRVAPLRIESGWEAPLRQFLRGVAEDDRIGDVTLVERVFGHSDYVHRPPGLVIENYMLWSADASHAKRGVGTKHIVRRGATDGTNQIHTWVLRPGWRSADAQLRYHHYKFKAWEDQMRKYVSRVYEQTPDWSPLPEGVDRDHPRAGYLGNPVSKGNKTSSSDPAVLEFVDLIKEGMACTRCGQHICKSEDEAGVIDAGDTIVRAEDFDPRCARLLAVPT